MIAAAAEFRPASELPPSTLTREEELEGIINDQAAQIEALRLPEARSQSRAQPPSLDVLAKMAELLQQNKELNEKVSKQALLMEKLVKDNGELHQDIHEIRDHFPKLIAEIKKRLTVLENGATSSDPKTVKMHLDGLYNNMKLTGLKQVSFRAASVIMKVSKPRLHQIKADLMNDNRFIIMKSESHSQKELIRLRE
jgi:predicted DNA-binding protein (UPF0251 family)